MLYGLQHLLFKGPPSASCLPFFKKTEYTPQTPLLRLAHRPLLWRLRLPLRWVGYALEFSSEDQVRLLPPSAPNLNVTLPTRLEQQQIYDWCCSKRAEAIQQFTAVSTSSSASNSSIPSPAITFSYPPPPLLNSMPISISTQASHTPAAQPLLSQFQLHQSKAAVDATSAPMSLNPASADTPDFQQKQLVPSTSDSINPLNNFPK